MSGNTRKSQVTRLVTLRHWSTMSGALVPEQAGVIRFGISLTGRGRVELRNPELTSAPEAQE